METDLSVTGYVEPGIVSSGAPLKYVTKVS